MKILFSYLLSKNSTSYELYRAFTRNKNIQLEYLFDNKQIETGIFQNNGSNSIFSKIMFKLKIPLDYHNINKLLLNYDFSKIDVLFTIKGNTIKPSTLKYIKNNYPDIKIISWSQDDMYAWHNRSIYYTLGIKYYDLIITQKSYNVNELKKLGAKKVFFQNKAYSKDIHKIYKCNDEQNIEVLFIGSFEKERYESMLYLAKNGIKVDIYGPGWEKYVKIHKNLVIHNKSLGGEDYSRALSCAKISLCFLRKINRDLQTSRSIEIPACGGFMIAERTEEHKKLFEEDKEAVFFDTKEELLEKVKFYLENEEKRKQIAKAGYVRTRNSGYSYDDRVKEILKYIKENL